MRKTIPPTMFLARDQSRLSMLQDWVLQHEVTEIEMNERQFWNFVSAQPVAEKPWTTFMGRVLHVSDMPVESQKCLGALRQANPRHDLTRLRKAAREQQARRAPSP